MKQALAILLVGWIIICLFNYKGALHRCSLESTDQEIQNSLYEWGYNHDWWDSPSLGGFLSAPIRRVQRALSNI
jgi:hypothetical protein